MKSKDTSSVREYFSAYKVEIIGGVATISTIAALGIANSVISNDDIRNCSPIEITNPEITNPDDLLREFELATGEYVKIHNLKSVGSIVYKSDAPYIRAVFESIGSSQYSDLRKPVISSIGNLVCTDTSTDITTYRLTQKAQTGAEALTESGVDSQSLSELVN